MYSACRCFEGQQLHSRMPPLKLSSRRWATRHWLTTLSTSSFPSQPSQRISITILITTLYKAVLLHWRRRRKLEPGSPAAILCSLMEPSCPQTSFISHGCSFLLYSLLQHTLTETLRLWFRRNCVPDQIQYFESLLQSSLPLLCSRVLIFFLFEECVSRLRISAVF